MFELFLFQEESNIFDFYNFGTTVSGDFAIFTGSHGEKEGATK